MADNVHTYTVQCSLPINLFNEKIFLIVWFWLYFTALSTLFGFLYWLISFFYPKFYRSNIIRYLSSMKRVNIHHFPENPFEEPIISRPHSSHSHRHQSSGRSHFNSSGRSNRHQRSLTSTYSNRGLKANLESARFTRMQEHLEIPIPTEGSSYESTIASTPEEQSVPESDQRKLNNQSSSITVLNEHSQIVTSFITNYLSHDGSLVLYLLKINTNEVITGEIVTSLFEIFKTSYRIDGTD